VAADVELALVRDLESYLRAVSGVTPRPDDVHDARADWQGRPARNEMVEQDVPLRGRRPFFWVTRSDSLAPATSADRARDLLGLAHIKDGRFLLELRFPRGQVDTIHRPTALDGLNNASWLPSVGSDGWGQTDDLAGSRPCPGVPEAVASETRVLARVWALGETTPSPAGSDP
jgi:hypothetical protein